MSQVFDLAEEVARGVRDRAGAWSFIRGFATHWMSPLTPEDGWGEAELAAAEDRLGLPLPAAVREAYGLFGRRTDMTSNQDQLLSPDDLHVDEAGEALIFREENQEVTYWGVPLADLGADDPRVVMWLDPAYGSAVTWDAWLDRFSLACLEMVLSEFLFIQDELCGYTDLSEKDVGLLEQRYTRLAIPEYPLCQAPPGTRWFAGPDVVLRDDGPHTALFDEDRRRLWARARTPDALVQAFDSLPGEWWYLDL